jgi:hypothetical protein
MADEAEQEKTDEVKESGTPEKTYTQKEVDRLLAIQKDKRKAAEAEVVELKQGKDETLAAYEARITALVDEMSKEIPPSILKLLKKLTPLEQLDYLSDPENNVVFEKKAFPIAPKKATGTPEFKPTPVEKLI